MINAITIIKKKQGLTYEKFQNYWKNEHAEIVTRSPLVGTYIQSHPIYNDELTFEDTIDGIAEIWFDDTNAMRSLAATKEYEDIQNDEIRLINYLSDHFMKILEVKNKIRSGYEKNFAIKSLRPPVFFKYITEFSKQVDLWSEKEIDFFLRKLFQCQSSSLKNSRSSKFQLYFLFLRILNFGNKH